MVEGSTARLCGAGAVQLASTPGPAGRDVVVDSGAPVVVVLLVLVLAGACDVVVPA